jgi:hypothetical protein
MLENEQLTWRRACFLKHTCILGEYVHTCVRAFFRPQKRSKTSHDFNFQKNGRRCAATRFLFRNETYSYVRLAFWLGDSLSSTRHGYTPPPPMECRSRVVPLTAQPALRPRCAGSYTRDPDIAPGISFHASASCRGSRLQVPTLLPGSGFGQGSPGDGRRLAVSDGWTWSLGRLSPILVPIFFFSCLFPFFLFPYSSIFFYFLFVCEDSIMASSR